MSTIRQKLSQTGILLVAVAFFGALLATISPPNTARAGQFSSRTLTMSSQASGNISTDANGNAVAAGAGGNGAKARHTFTFTLGTSGATIGSVLLQYCTTPLLGTSCTAPTGMDASTVASIQAISGFAATAPTLDTTTNAGSGGYFGTVPCSGGGVNRSNCILLARGTPTAESGTPAFTLGFGTGGGTDWIKNPTSAGTFYVRIIAFSDIAYTTVVDEAAVAGSVNTNIDITAKVQEKLNFSVAAGHTAPGGSCTALSGSGAVQLGDINGVLDIATAYDAYSYFRLSTNASGGSQVLFSGDTLKTASGTNSITGLAAETNSTPGTSQFGLALDTTHGNHSFTSLGADTDYDNADGNINPVVAAQFNFNTASVTTPERIAFVGAGTVVSCDTGAVRYIGNIDSTTKAGIYRTTIAYIATATF
jgi:hypothetical protein